MRIEIQHLTQFADFCLARLGDQSWVIPACVGDEILRLREYNKNLEESLQDTCEHKSFSDGVCKECGFECEHNEREDGFCVDCGMGIVDAGDYEDMLYEQERDRRAGL